MALCTYLWSYALTYGLMYLLMVLCTYLWLYELTYGLIYLLMAFGTYFLTHLPIPYI